MGKLGLFALCVVLWLTTAAAVVQRDEAGPGKELQPTHPPVLNATKVPTPTAPPKPSPPPAHANHSNTHSPTLNATAPPTATHPPRNASSNSSLSTSRPSLAPTTAPKPTTSTVKPVATSQPTAAATPSVISHPTSAATPAVTSHPTMAAPAATPKQTSAAPKPTPTSTNDSISLPGATSPSTSSGLWLTKKPANTSSVRYITPVLDLPPTDPKGHVVATVGTIYERGDRCGCGKGTIPLGCQSFCSHQKEPAGYQKFTPIVMDVQKQPAQAKPPARPTGSSRTILPKEIPSSNSTKVQPTASRVASAMKNTVRKRLPAPGKGLGKALKAMEAQLTKKLKKRRKLLPKLLGIPAGALGAQNVAYDTYWTPHDTVSGGGGYGKMPPIYLA